MSCLAAECKHSSHIAQTWDPSLFAASVFAQPPLARASPTLPKCPTRARTPPTPHHCRRFPPACELDAAIGGATEARELSAAGGGGSSLAQGGGFDDARVEPVMVRAAPARHMAEVEAEPRRHNSEEAGEGEHGAATGNPNLAPPPPPPPR